MEIQECISRFVRYIQFEKNLSKKTIKAYISDLNGFRKFLNVETVEELDINHIRDYLTFLDIERCCKDITIKRKIATLRVFFSFLLNENIIGRSPIKNLSAKFRTKQSLPQVMSRVEIKQLLSCAHEHVRSTRVHVNNGSKSSSGLLRSLRDRVILEILFSTGIRIGELVSIDVENIDLSENIVTVSGKGGRERRIYLSSHEVILTIKEYLECRMKTTTKSDAFLINKYGGRLSIYSVENIFRKYCILAGIENHYTPHCLRHTMATMLIENGANIRVVQEILGHASITTTQIYTRVSTNLQKETMLRFNERNLIQVSD